MSSGHGSEAVDPDERDGIDYEARVASAIDQGLADAQAGRMVDDDALDEVLRARLGGLID